MVAMIMFSFTLLFEVVDDDWFTFFFRLWDHGVGEFPVDLYSRLVMGRPDVVSGCPVELSHRLVKVGGVAP